MKCSVDFHRCIIRAIGVAVLLLGGCAKHESRVDAATRDKVLLFGNGSEPATLDPNTQAAAIEATINGALFEGLINTGIDGVSILPGVAEKWEVSADKLVYTFHLRANARWSDGSPVTADDFEFSFRRVFTPTIGCITADLGYAIAGASDFQNGRNPSPQSVGVRAIDPRTLEIRLAHPAAYFLYVVGSAPFLPVPRAVVERFGGATQPGTPWTRPGNMVSNGAFVLKSWQSSANVTVVKNPFYWDSAHVRLNEVRFYPIDSADTEERAFRSGELHLTYRVPLSKLAGYHADPAAPLHVTPLLATWFVTFNTARPPFDKASVRRAFSLAIDREQLIPAVLHDNGSPAHALTRPGTGGYTAPSRPDHDPALARRLLAEAGYPGGAGFPAVEFNARDSGSDTLVAEALQQVWLRELGVKIAIAQLEPKVAISSYSAHDYQFGISGYFYSMQAPEMILTLARGDAPSNIAGWKNAEFDAAFRAAEAAASEKAHSAAVDTLEKLVSTEVPYAPLYYYNQCQLVHPSLRGWRGNFLQQTDWRELWLEDAK